MSNLATSDVAVLGNEGVGFKIVNLPTLEGVGLCLGQQVAESGDARIEMKRAVAAESSKRILRPAYRSSQVGGVDGRGGLTTQQRCRRIRDADRGIVKCMRNNNG